MERVLPRQAVLTIAIVLLACAREPSNFTENDGFRVRISQAEDAGTFVALESTPSSRLVWREGSGHLIWRSDDLYGAKPYHEIADFNGDGRTELFWSILHEEIARSAVVRRSLSSVEELTFPAPECALGNVERRSTGFLFILQTPGALSEEECEDPILRSCAERFNMYWPRAFALTESTLVDVPFSRVEYEVLARAFSAGANDLARLMESEERFPGATVGYDVCGSARPARMRFLADSALALARNR